MYSPRVLALIAAGACAALVPTASSSLVSAQAARRALARGTSTDLNGFLSAVLLFGAADANKDNAVTREEGVPIGSQRRVVVQQHRQTARIFDGFE